MPRLFMRNADKYVNPRPATVSNMASKLFFSSFHVRYKSSSKKVKANDWLESTLVSVLWRCVWRFCNWLKFDGFVIRKETGIKTLMTKILKEVVRYYGPASSFTENCKCEKKNLWKRHKTTNLFLKFKKWKKTKLIGLN